MSYIYYTHTERNPIISYSDPSCNTLYGNFSIADGYETTNINPSRVKPADPLWASPTSIAEKTRITYGYCEGKKSLGPNPWCIEKFQHSYNQPTWPYPPYNMPDWETPMRLKIKEEALNLGQNMAEYREAAGAFERITDSLVELAKCAKRRGRGSQCKKFKRRFKKEKKINNQTFSNGILAQNYGVHPLMSDMYETLLRLDDSIERPILRRYVVKRVTEDREYNAYVKNEYKTSARAIIYVRFKANAGKFTAGNPEQLLWEMIPFSFIVDQMIPIGDYLASLDALKDVQSIIGTLTVKRHQTWSYYKGIDHQGYPLVKKEPTIFETFGRSVLTTVPVGAFPGYEPSKSLKAVWNGINLLNALRDADEGSDWYRKLHVPGMRSRNK